ncbi:hypothetical protein SteCoe_13897 [Stentor coeruleus]|uniref:Uncharacterized protein n=1 Tax=Stentor coeruleus TaxID=5963 RepID=A0A1R2C7B7_9CILI|nr:hypothetical protein SteCoe_13897 [Stentor coeruleus]
MVKKIMISLFLISLAYSAQPSIQSSLLHVNHETIELLQVQGTDTTEEMVCTCLPEDDVILETEDDTPPFENEEECADAFSIVVTCEGDNCTVTDTSDTIDFEVDCDSEDQCLTDINLNVVNSAPEVETELAIPVFLQQDESDDGSCLEEVHATITCEDGGDCSITDDSEEFDFEVVSNEDGILDVIVVDSDMEAEECSEEVTVTITCDGESCVVSDDSSTYDLSVDEDDIEITDIDVDSDNEPVEAECVEDVVVTITCTDGICVASDDSDNYDVSLSDDSGDELVLDVVEVGLEGEDCTEIAQLDIECDGGVCVVDDDTSAADAIATVDEVIEIVDEDEDDDEESEEDLDDEEEILEDLDDAEEENEDDNDFAEESEDIDDIEEAAEDLDDNDEITEDVDDNLPIIDTDDEATEDLDDAENEIEDLDDEANENEDDNDDEEELEDMDDPMEEIEDQDDDEEIVEDEDDDEEAIEDLDDPEEECEEGTDEVHLTIECTDGVDCDVSDDSDEYDFVVTNVGDDQIDIVLLPEGLDESECTETVTVTMSCDGEGCEVESNSDSYDLGIEDNTLVAQEIDTPTFLSLQSN